MMEKMGNRSKVQKAITNFKEWKSQNEGSSSLGSLSTNSVIKSGTMNSSVAVDLVGKNTNTVAGQHEIMNEFDQFVLHSDMQKKIKEVFDNSKFAVVNKECHSLDNVHEGQNEKSCMAMIQLDQEEENQTDTDRDDINQQDVAGTPDDMQIDMEENSQVQEDEYENPSDEEQPETSSKGRTNEKEEYTFPSPEEINRACPPAVGMVFETLQEAVRFVNVYGQLCGFAVIKGRNYKNRKISLNCNKARKTISSVTGARKRKRSTIDRTGCGMNVTVKSVDGKWHVLSCNLEHNHALAASPSLTKFFLSHQTMNEEEKMLSRLLQEIRVKPRGIMTIFRKLRGNFGNIMFSTKKLDNMKQIERKQKKNSDIEYTMKYIEKIQMEKPGFCYKIERDSEGAVRSIFWTDARSRLDYKMYGDIISFDTTYSTNRYNMPFAPIIGINGHGRTIVFGWALLKNEKATTFEWLFETFVEVMQGKKPKIVLTDQDMAMKKAASAVFPSAFHRWCIFHVFRKMREHLSPVMATMEGMETEIVRLIMQSLTTEEFEAGWKQMEETYDCGKHEHIMRMWKYREMYVSAYFRGQFCPFTRSTSRSESFNSNFKDYVKRKDTIETFLKQYEIFQENIIEIENHDRFESSQKIPVFWCRQLIERHAGKIYNRGIYCKFVTELLNSTAFQVIEIERDKQYKLKKMFRYENPEYWRDMFTVHVDRNNMKFECECGKFERDGVLCCHILRLFTQFDVMEIPQHFIVDRWTIEYREKELIKYKKESIEMYGEGITENALRYALIMNTVSDLCSDISRNQNKSSKFIEEVIKVHARLMDEEEGQEKDAPQTLLLKDPPVIKKAHNKDKCSTQSGKKPKETATGEKTDNVAAEHFSSVSNFDSAGMLKSTTHVQQGEKMYKSLPLATERSILPVEHVPVAATSKPVEEIVHGNSKKRSKSVPSVKTGAVKPGKSVNSNVTTVSEPINLAQGEPLSLKDPPVSDNASVVKGNRMKPQYEKKSAKKGSSKKKDTGTD